MPPCSLLPAKRRDFPEFNQFIFSESKILRKIGRPDRHKKETAGFAQVGWASGDAEVVNLTKRIICKINQINTTSR